eukprot:6182219-Pleurochrysis_carterae.AAC.1
MIEVEWQLCGRGGSAGASPPASICQRDARTLGPGREGKRPRGCEVKSSIFGEGGALSCRRVGLDEAETDTLRAQAASTCVHVVCIGVRCFSPRHTHAARAPSVFTSSLVQFQPLLSAGLKQVAPLISAWLVARTCAAREMHTRLASAYACVC